MTERQRLLHRVQICDFVLDDVRLYLDSHPCDRAALDYYKKHLEMRDKAYKEYVEQYGPLTSLDSAVFNCDKWTWVDGPWPWEREA